MSIDVESFAAVPDPVTGRVSATEVALAEPPPPVVPPDVPPVVVARGVDVVVVVVVAVVTGVTVVTGVVGVDVGGVAVGAWFATSSTETTLSSPSTSWSIGVTSGAYPSAVIASV